MTLLDHKYNLHTFIKFPFLIPLHLYPLFQLLPSSIPQPPNPNSPFQIQMSPIPLDSTTKIHPQQPSTDHFNHLPDPLILLIFNNINDVKSLGRCCTVSKRFHTLIPQVQNITLRVDCVISNSPTSNKSPTPFSTLARFLFGAILKPIQSITRNLLSPDQSHPCPVTHHSPSQVLKIFKDIRSLKIELPTGELGVEKEMMLKWKAEFGSTLNNCVMLGASSVITPPTNFTPSGPTSNRICNRNGNRICNRIGNGNGDGDGNGNGDSGNIPESFYTNGGLKLRVVWTISSLIAASARHYLLQRIISEHKTLDSVVLTDGDGQGVLCMDKGQLEELRLKPLLASSALKRTLVPALNMRLWYAPCLELDDGRVLKGATLVAIRPSEFEEVGDGSWVASAFEEPYGAVARMLVKRRTYCLEMNSF